MERIEVCCPQSGGEEHFSGCLICGAELVYNSPSAPSGAAPSAAGRAPATPSAQTGTMSATSAMPTEPSPLLSRSYIKAGRKIRC